ncbi:MAG: undecaprenyl-diphosphatase [Thermodesulfovibrionales bacterium]|jgi:undecaprenyl-diphosphatase|nr:undecaprenyl-diphosphatase [Thermodesulfovibrionales bacterium]
MLEEINYSLFSSVNKFAGYNPIFDITAELTAEYLPFLFILLMMYYWFFKKDDTSRINLLSVGWSTLLALFINFLITLFYFHPRPFMVHIGKLLISHGPETSFPSDHATFMFSIAFAFIIHNEFRKIGIVLIILALIGGMARVFVGVHFPMDIAGSFGVGLISTMIIFILRDVFAPMNERIVEFYKDVLLRLDLKYLKRR